MRLRIFLLYAFSSIIGLNQAKSIAKSELKNYSSNPIVQLFQEYIRIDTSDPENIYQAVEFWRGQADSLGAKFRVFEPAGKPVCVITVEGSDPTLPSIMLNSHMDVVPAVAEDWNYPPFAAYMDENGDIFGRGTQDTKDVSIQYIEALQTLKTNNVTLRRTMHMTLMPDEETGSFYGMKPFLNTTDFEDLNVGFALDEGLGSPDDTLFATYVDKRPWQMTFTFYGTAAHASTIPDNTAMEKAARFIDRVTEMREQQKIVMKAHDDVGSYTTININILSAGTVVNIIPGKVQLMIDMRLATSADATDMQNMIDSWMSEAGANTTMEFTSQVVESAATTVDETNRYWMAILEAASEMGIPVKPGVCPATSDMLVLRNRGIPAIGLAPKFYTDVRLHGVDEYLNAGTLLQGVDFYVKILTKLGNLV